MEATERLFVQAIVVLAQWERVYTLLSFLWLRPSLSSNRFFPIRATDVVLLDLRVPLLPGGGEGGLYQYLHHVFGFYQRATR